MKRTGNFFKILIFTTLSFVPNFLFAEIEISVSADRTKVALNESFQLSVTISGSGNLPAPQLPDLSQFTVYSSGRSQNISFINGQISSSLTYRYILTPKSLGTFTIAPFSITVDGKSYQSQPLTIEVVQATPQSAIPHQAPPVSRAPSSKPSAFVKLSLNKSRVFLNEEVILSFRFYHRLRLISNPEYRAPDLTGFIVEDLPPPRNFTEQVEGIPYQVTEIKTALFPTKSGVLKIPPAELKIQVQDLSFDPFSDDFFRNFFSGGFKEYRLRTEPVTLTVLELPSKGQPAHFSGGVGKFKISSSVDKNKIAVGEALTLTVSIEGQGNIKSLADPKWPEFVGFRRYDTASSLNLDKSKGKVEGSKVYKVVLVPQSSGRAELPSISFNYFDLESKEYRTLKTLPILLEVEPAKTNVSASPNFASQFQSPEIKRLQTEIRYIKTGELSSFSWHYKRMQWKILFFFPLLPLLFAGIYRGKLILEEKSPERRRIRLAYKVAQMHLREAERDFKEGRLEDSTQKIFLSLQKYLADKMLVSQQEISLKNAKEFLEQAQVNSQSFEELESFWKNLELARFSPAKVTHQDLQKFITSGRELLSSLEKSLKGHKKILPKKFLIPIFLIAISSLTYSAEQSNLPSETTFASDVFKEANQAYQSGDFARALQLYSQLQGSSNCAKLQYNLGNTYYKLGQTGFAIRCWISAIRMNPRDGDIKFNLNYATTKINEPYFSENILLRWGQELFYLLNLNELFILLLSIWWIASGFWSLALVGKMKLGRLKNSVLIACLLSCGGWWLLLWNEQERKKWAVVTGNVAEVRSGPGSQFAVGFTVPEGRRLLLMDQTGDWQEVILPKESLKGWVEKKYISKI